MQHRITTEVNSLKPYFKKITESPEEFLQFIGGLIGLCDGIFGAIHANKFTLYSTIKLQENMLWLRFMSIFISIGIRANWYYNLGAGCHVLKKISSAITTNNELSFFTRSHQYARILTNKQIGQVIGVFIGVYIYMYVLSERDLRSMSDLFKSPNYADLNSNAYCFDQIILIAGGLSNLFSYMGNWIDGITGNRTIIHLLPSSMNTTENNINESVSLANSDLDISISKVEYGSVAPT